MPRLAQLMTPATTSAYSAAISRLREDLGIRFILRERTITGPPPPTGPPPGEIEKNINI